MDGNAPNGANGANNWHPPMAPPPANPPPAANDNEQEDPMEAEHENADAMLQNPEFQNAASQALANDDDEPGLADGAAGPGAAPMEEDDGPLISPKNLVKVVAALTPIMLRQTNAVGTLISSMVVFTGDGKVAWADWVRTLQHRASAVGLLPEQLSGAVLGMLQGSAAAYAQANGLTAATPWAEFAATMAAGPFASRETSFSLWQRLTHGNLGNGNVADTIAQLMKLKAKFGSLGHQLPDSVWINALLSNLKSEFRDRLLTTQDGREWSSFDAIRTAANGLWAAANSANKSTSSKQPPKVSYKDKVLSKTSTPRPRPSGRSDPGAGPSDTHAHKKRKPDGPVCFGCGSSDHKISDRDAAGNPVCPNYDENRLRKGKYPMHPPKKNQGNGKGK